MTLTNEERNMLSNIEKNGSINSSPFSENKNILDSLELKGYLKSKSSLWTRTYFPMEEYWYQKNIELFKIDDKSKILANLLYSPKFKSVWSFKNGRFLKLNDNDDIEIVKLDGFNISFENQDQWNQTLIENINKISDELFKSNKSSASWIISSKELINKIFNSFDNFIRINEPTTNTVNVKVGILNFTFSIYENINMPMDKIIIGYGDGTNSENCGVIVIYDIF